MSLLQAPIGTTFEAWRNATPGFPPRSTHLGRLPGFAARPSPARVFTNPLYSGADPFVAQRNGRYHLIQTGEGGRLEVWDSETPVERGVCKVVWSPPATGWNRAEIWAPELHFISGRWYIYYAASDGRNPTHRMGVLESATADPQGPYIDRGMLFTGDRKEGRSVNRWAIDGTVLQHRTGLHFVWSGWEDERDIQHLYIARMSDPCTVSTERVRICPNDCHLWERVGERPWERGLNEGPQLLTRNGRTFLIYSCSGSWQPSYKLGMLFMDEAADPMGPSSWQKYNAPVFESTSEVFGVGHCCFTQSPDGTEDWMLYHSKRFRHDCWDRVVRAQPFTWTRDGFPYFGSPAPTAVQMAMPSDGRSLPRPAKAA